MDKEEICLRRERPEDYRAVEELTRQAFWNHYAEGCDEHYLAHILRGDGAFVDELDVVAVADGTIVGNIMYTKAQIKGDDGSVRPVLCFGPVSVLPTWQGRGVGSRLIKATLRRAEELGYQAVLIYGDPAYYGRFGFVAAQTFGIATADDQYADALLALELQPGALQGMPGRFEDAPIFSYDPEQAAQFDAQFPKRERLSGLPSQQRFQVLAAKRRPRHP